jgi:hypothetical protein
MRTTPETQPLRSIPTSYAGVTFRSRLEADWAHNLTVVGIAWSYEPDGIILPNGQRYLPDFWLPDINTWLEVKGPGVPGLDKTEELVNALAEPDPHNPQRGEYGWTIRQAVVIAMPSVGSRAAFKVACRYCGRWVASNHESGAWGTRSGAYLETCTCCGKTMFVTYDDGCGMESRCWVCGEKTSTWSMPEDPAVFHRAPRIQRGVW